MPWEDLVNVSSCPYIVASQYSTGEGEGIRSKRSMMPLDATDDEIGYQ